MTGRFHQAMHLMRRRDPQDQEDGFHLLLPYAAEQIDQLIAIKPARTELWKARANGLID